MSSSCITSIYLDGKKYPIPRLHKDNKFAERACKANGFIFKYLSDKQHDDQKLAEIARDVLPESVQHASTRLRAKQDFMRPAVLKKPELIDYFRGNQNNSSSVNFIKEAIELN